MRSCSVYFRHYSFYERVGEYIAELDFQKFKWDNKTVDAVIRNFEIIGEATKNLPADLKEKYPSIPWDEMYRLQQNKPRIFRN